MTDPFQNFSNTAKLLEEMQPMIDMLNAMKATLVRETGCTEAEAMSIAVAVAVKGFRDATPPLPNLGDA